MAFDGTYLKVYEFTHVYFQTNSTGTITEQEFKWPNKLTPSSEQQTYEWQGGGAKKKISVLIAQNWTLDLDAIPLAAHKTIFGKSEITDAGAADAYFDISTLVGFGGGSDAAGVTRGLRAVANALAGDNETVVTMNLWAPVCTITLSAAGGLSSGNIGDKTQYSISATKTLVDVTGASIAGASSDGEFFFIGQGA
jgi:hypothetical protein